MNYVSDVETPLGRVRIVADEQAVIAVGFNPEKNAKLNSLDLNGNETESTISREAARQVGEYFAGQRKHFELPVSFGQASEFADAVLACLNGVPYGEILTYGGLAAVSGHPQAARAVGRVMASNPIPIIVPCHRVVGSNGRMTGYSGGEGIATKEWLLAFERENSL